MERENEGQARVQNITIHLSVGSWGLIIYAWVFGGGFVCGVLTALALLYL